MDGEQFVTLLIEHNIGVERTTSDLFELDETFAAGGIDRSVQNNPAADIWLGPTFLERKCNTHGR